MASASFQFIDLKIAFLNVTTRFPMKHLPVPRRGAVAADVVLSRASDRLRPSDAAGPIAFGCRRSAR